MTTFTIIFILFIFPGVLTILPKSYKQNSLAKSNLENIHDKLRQNMNDYSSSVDYQNIAKIANNSTQVINLTLIIHTSENQIALDLTSTIGNLFKSQFYITKDIEAILLDSVNDFVVILAERILDTIKLNSKRINLTVTLNDKIFSVKQFVKEKTKNYREVNLLVKPIPNPCYLKGYKNLNKGIIGTGSYPKCFELLSKILSKNETLSIAIPDSGKAIVLGEDFKHINNFIGKEKTTKGEMKLMAIKVCGEDYLTFSSRISSNYDDICLRLVYSIIIFDNLFGNDDNQQFILSTNLKDTHLKDENSFYLNSVNTDVKKIPAMLIVFYTIFIALWISTLIFKQDLVRYINLNKKQELEDNNKNIDSLINSLPVKNYIFSKLFKEVETLLRREQMLTFKDYRNLVCKLKESDIGLNNIMKKTIIQRNELKVKSFISVLLIILTIIASVLTNKIVCYIVQSTKKNYNFLLIICSLFFMSFLIFQFLQLISQIEVQRYLNSDQNSHAEVKLLEEDLDDTINDFMN